MCNRAATPTPRRSRPPRQTEAACSATVFERFRATGSAETALGWSASETHCVPSPNHTSHTLEPYYDLPLRLSIMDCSFKVTFSTAHFHSSFDATPDGRPLSISNTRVLLIIFAQSMGPRPQKRTYLFAIPTLKSVHRPPTHFTSARGEPAPRRFHEASRRDDPGHGKVLPVMHDPFRLPLRLFCLERFLPCPVTLVPLKHASPRGSRRCYRCASAQPSEPAPVSWPPSRPATASARPSPRPAHRF